MRMSTVNVSGGNEILRYVPLGFKEKSHMANASSSERMIVCDSEAREQFYVIIEGNCSGISVGRKLQVEILLCEALLY